MKISVSDKATEMIKRIIEDKKAESPSVRIYIQGMG